MLHDAAAKLTADNPGTQEDEQVVSRLNGFGTTLRSEDYIPEDTSAQNTQDDFNNNMNSTYSKLNPTLSAGIHSRTNSNTMEDLDSNKNEDMHKTKDMESPKSMNHFKNYLTKSMNNPNGNAGPQDLEIVIETSQPEETLRKLSPPSQAMMSLQRPTNGITKSIIGTESQSIAIQESQGDEREELIYQMN